MALRITELGPLADLGPSHVRCGRGKREPIGAMLLREGPLLSSRCQAVNKCPLASSYRSIAPRHSERFTSFSTVHSTIRCSPRPIEHSSTAQCTRLTGIAQPEPTRIYPHSTHHTDTFLLRNTQDAGIRERPLPRPRVRAATPTFLFRLWKVERTHVSTTTPVKHSRP